MRNISHKFHKPGRLFLLLLAGMISLGFLLGCVSSRGFRTGYAGMFMQKPSLIPGPFEDLWEARTVLLSKSSDTPSLFSSGGPDRRSGFGPFPLTVRATFMDSLVIEQGLKLYASLAGLSEAEAQAYRERYRAEHHTDKYLYVWAELSTRYHESYLQLDRWIFFLENESEQQFEPVQVVEKPEYRREFFPGSSAADSNTGGTMNSRTPPDLPVSQRAKIVEFYFPRMSFFNKPVVGPKTRSISLVVVDRENLNERAAGTWHFDRF